MRLGARHQRSEQAAQLGLERGVRGGQVDGLADH
jgi:hypothetical protein